MGIFAGRFVAFCWLTFCVVWLVAAFWTRRTVERQRRWSRSWFWVLVVAVLLFLRRRGTGLFSVGLWSYSPVLGVVADAVTLAGLLVALWARMTLGGYWSSSVVLKQDHQIIVRGPYRYVRHPIYSGVLLMVLGTVVLWGSLVALLLFPVAFSGLWMKLHLEERLLTTHFPEAYRHYQSRVRSALIPFVL
jgi:protein-S-isoprenylcysteine O-methyltransferase Ste14